MVNNRQANSSLHANIATSLASNVSLPLANDAMHASLPRVKGEKKKKRNPFNESRPLSIPDLFFSVFFLISISKR